MRHTLLLAILCSIVSFSFQHNTNALQEENPSTFCENTLKEQPLYFIENRGQLHDDVAYYLQGRDKTLFFTETGITFSLSGKGDSSDPWVVKLDFLGANHGVKPEGRELQEARFSYFKGDSEDWSTNNRTYSKLCYHDLWPGIDLILTGSDQRLKQEFVVKPGADPSMVRLAYRGASEVSLTERGALEIRTPSGSFEDETPFAYQMIDGERREIDMAYHLEQATTEGNFPFHFDIGAYDPAQSLILDPAIFIYCGFIGGDVKDIAGKVAVDDSGCAYVTGTTTSAWRFPAQVGPDLTHNGGSDAFVAKIRADGRSTIYCGFIGGSDDDGGRDIAVDGDGFIYITGTSRSSDFPTRKGPDLTYNGSLDTFVTKVNPAGTTLVYSGFIGGADMDYGYSLALDTDGCVYVTGFTYSDENTFPVKQGPSLVFDNSSGDEGFIAKVNPDGSDFVYCGYIDQWPSLESACCDVDVDDSGCAYVLGSMEPSLGSRTNFLKKVDSTGTQIEYTFEFGSSHYGFAQGVAVDESNCAYFVGYAYLSEYGYIYKLASNGEDVIYSLKVDGDSYDSIHDIAVDSEGYAYIVGKTSSSPNSIPVSLGPDLTLEGNSDAFIAKIRRDGSGFEYCGYIGGDTGERAKGVAVDGRNNAYVVGTTVSTEITFPVTVGPSLEHASPGKEDAFITRISMALDVDTHTLSIGGGTINFFLNAHQDRARRHYALLASLSGTDPGTVLPGGSATLPLNLDGFSDIMLSLINTSALSNFMGRIDGKGESTAQLNAPALDPALVGTSVYFAYCLYGPFDFASNAVTIELVP